MQIAEGLCDHPGWNSYGIANLQKEVIPYYYFAKGGVKTHNPDRDRVKISDGDCIRLRKRRVIDADKSRYEVELTDFRKRNAIAVIEPGSEYVKTFLPLDEKWFDKHTGSEAVLKGNSTMTLKELARFHIEKTI
jgi:hypothetical protein